MDDSPGVKARFAEHVKGFPTLIFLSKGKMSAPPTACTVVWTTFSCCGTLQECTEFQGVVRKCFRPECIVVLQRACMVVESVLTSRWAECRVWTWTK